MEMLARVTSRRGERTPGAEYQLALLGIQESAGLLMGQPLGAEKAQDRDTAYQTALGRVRYEHQGLLGQFDGLTVTGYCIDGHLAGETGL